MTTYGTIPTSSSPPINMEYIARAKDRLKAGLGTRRPWRQMFDIHCLSLPHSFREALTRLKTNFSYFMMNYALIVLVILFLSLIWHPISLLVFAAMMALWVFLYFLRDEPLVIFSRTISDRTILILLSVVTIFVLMFTHAVTEILSALLVGFVLVAVHGAVRETDDLEGGDEEEGFLRT